MVGSVSRKTMMLDAQPVIDRFLARNAPCAVCGAATWAVGELIGLPFARDGRIGGLRAPVVLAQSFRCAGCDNLALISLGRSDQMDG